jgi:hypothetical protein
MRGVEIMFAIRKGKILKVDVVRSAKRGMKVWCKPDGQKKLKLISCGRIFENEQDAIKSLKHHEIMQQKKRERIGKAIEAIEKECLEIEKVVFKIMDEFDVEIKFLDRPTSLEEAWEMYYKFNNDDDTK